MARLQVDLHVLSSSVTNLNNAPDGLFPRLACSPMIGSVRFATVRTICDAAILMGMPYVASPADCSALLASCCDGENYSTPSTTV
jgi:hypothetical protein